MYNEEKTYGENMKKHRKLKIFGIILLTLTVFFAVINLIPPKKNVQSNPFILAEGELPMIAAHRGGGENNPENTMLAFREAVLNIGVDIIESDLYLTKDGYLVYNHDGYIDRTSDVNGDITKEELDLLLDNKSNRHYISDMTLEELRKYNFGYYFENENGERIYKDTLDIEGAAVAVARVLGEDVVNERHGHAVRVQHTGRFADVLFERAAADGGGAVRYEF